MNQQTIAAQLKCSKDHRGKQNLLRVYSKTMV